MVGLKLSIEEKLREFLKEDIGFGDITSEALIGDDQMADARIFYRENGIAAGYVVPDLGL
jgi:nicotinate-nucleotide pyrophosphorylase (carboxylating)